MPFVTLQLARIFLHTAFLFAFYSPLFAMQTPGDGSPEPTEAQKEFARTIGNHRASADLIAAARDRQFVRNLSDAGWTHEDLDLIELFPDLRHAIDSAQHVYLFGFEDFPIPEKLPSSLAGKEGLHVVQIRTIRAPFWALQGPTRPAWAGSACDPPRASRCQQKSERRLCYHLRRPLAQDTREILQ